MYLEPNEIKPNGRSLNQFTQELFLLSFIACNTLHLKQSKNECGITEFTKICTNYIEDMNENMKTTYKPFADCTSNPFGMVSYIPIGLLDYKDYKKKIDKIYVYQLDTFAKNKNLWHIEKSENIKRIIFEIEPQDFKDILIRREYGGEEILSTSFDKIEIGRLEALSIIYQQFNAIELNILASHRDSEKSDMCLKYVFRGWSKYFNSTLELLEASSIDDDKFKGSIMWLWNFIEGIHRKTKYIKNGVPKLLNDIDTQYYNNVKNSDRQAADIMSVMINRIKRTAPIFGEEKYKTYFEAIKTKYRIFLEEILPLSKVLFHYIEQCSYMNNGKKYLEGFENLMRNRIFKLPALNEIQFSANLHEIREGFQSLIDRYPRFLHPLNTSISYEKSKYK